MTSRDRLIALLQRHGKGGGFGLDGLCENADIIADYLLENGVIVPPCHVYDTVFRIAENGKIEEYTVVEIAKDSYYGSAYVLIEKEVGEYSKTQMTCDFESFGVTVFTNRKEAENAIKEYGNNDRQSYKNS